MHPGDTKCHELILMVKLLIINVSQQTFQNWVSGTIMHVTVDIINGVLMLGRYHKVEESSCM